MEPNKDFTVQQLHEKIAHYRNAKRLQGFLRHKCRNQFAKLQNRVRKLKLGIEPSPEDRIYLTVSKRNRCKPSAIKCI